MMTSLRGRLFAGLALVVVVIGAIGGGVAYDWAFDEAIEAQDTVLTQIAAVAARTNFKLNQTIPGGDLESQVTIRELGDKPTGTQTPALWLLKDGLHTDLFSASPSRVMLRTRSDGTRFVVAQPTSIRDEIARDSAIQALIPFAMLIPCLALVFALVIARSLRPMLDLAVAFDSRRGDDLSQVSIEGTLSELHPFIGSVNRLFERIQGLMEQQKLFIADAAHELRTPITALVLQAENLQQTELSQDGKVRLERLRDGARRTAHLLDQLLTLARYDADATKLVAMCALDVCAKEVVAELVPIASELSIDLGFDRIEPVIVAGDVVMLSVMIRNLIDNALRATPHGGQIDVSVFREGDLGIVEIVDSGPGIPEADLARIFEPFYRGSQPTTDGTGLGLAIVKRIAGQLRGNVELVNVRAGERSGLKAIVRLLLDEVRN